MYHITLYNTLLLKHIPIHFYFIISVKPLLEHVQK